MSYVLMVWFYEFQPRAGLWVGDEVLTTYLHKAKHYKNWESVRTELKHLRKKYIHAFWQPIEIRDDNDQIVIPLATTEAETQKQIDYSQDPGVFHHLCPRARMDCIKLPSGVTCLCGTGTADGTS